MAVAAVAWIPSVMKTDRGQLLLIDLGTPVAVAVAVAVAAAVALAVAVAVAVAAT